MHIYMPNLCLFVSPVRFHRLRFVPCIHTVTKSAQNVHLHSPSSLFPPCFITRPFLHYPENMSYFVDPCSFQDFPYFVDSRMNGGLDVRNLPNLKWCFGGLVGGRNFVFLFFPLFLVSPNTPSSSPSAVCVFSLLMAHGGIYTGIRHYEIV